MKSEKVAYIAVVMIQSSFAGMFLLSKAAFSSGLSSSVFVAYRQALATLALAPLAFIFHNKASPPLSWRALCKIFLISIWLGLSFNLNFAGLKYTSATLSSAILNIVPVMVFIMTVSLRIENLDIKHWHGIAKVAGSLIALSGAMAFTFYKGPPMYSSSSSTVNLATKDHSKEEWIKGSICTVAGHLVWSLWLTLQGPLLKQYPGNLRLTTLQCGFSCIATTVYGAAVERDVSSWKLGWNIGLVSVTYCGIVVTGISYWVQSWVVETKGAVFSAIFSPLALVLSAILSAVFLHETLHWGSVVGGVLIVGGLYCFLWGKNREPQIQLNLEPPIWESTTEAPLSIQLQQEQPMKTTNNNDAHV